MFEKNIPGDQWNRIQVAEIMPGTLRYIIFHKPNPFAEGKIASITNGSGKPGYLHAKDGT